MPRQPQMPIGLQVANTAKALSREFDRALGAAGGTLASWQILLALVSREPETQRELADAVGIRGPTLTHHLDALAGSGLIERKRDPHNRRVQRVELTETGWAAFHRLREAAMGFDELLREGIG